jgi:hypothetical protein
MGKRLGLSELERLVRVTRAKTLKSKEAVDARREERKKGASKIDFDGLTKPIQERKKRVNSVDVEQWFRKGIGLLYGEKVTISPWGRPEQKLAVTMLDVYGAELTEKAVGYFCEHWELICEKSKNISGIPTVKLLWVMRDTIFPDVQLGKKPKVERKKRKHDVGEYKGGHEPRGIGW